MRPPPIGVPDSDTAPYSVSPDIAVESAWTCAHLAPLFSHATPPPTHSLRAFEEWYRRRLLLCNAASPWSLSRSPAMCAMLDLWILCCLTDCRIAALEAGKNFAPFLPRNPPSVLRT